MRGGQLSTWASCSVPCQGPAGPGHSGAAESTASRRALVTAPPVCVCFASHPRCRCPPIVAVVTVTPAPPIVLLTYRCRLLVLESRSLHLPLSVCQSSQSDCELSEALAASPSLPAWHSSFPSCPPATPVCALALVVVLCVLPSPEAWGTCRDLAWGELSGPTRGDLRLGVSKPLSLLLPLTGLRLRARCSGRARLLYLSSFEKSEICGTDCLCLAQRWPSHSAAGRVSLCPLTPGSLLFG